MKSATWSGRWVIWITRGEVPVDGAMHVEPRAPGHDEPLNPELDRCVHEAEAAGLIPRAPVRWGNFR